MKLKININFMLDHAISIEVEISDYYHGSLSLYFSMPDNFTMNCGSGKTPLTSMQNTIVDEIQIDI
ncbi:hypothetical protein C0J52_06223 [Blattella germanica]|nr:hypothetical protein C0J52_06223 [Blattella germanica]